MRAAVRALSLRAVAGAPIRYLGTGEKIEALEPFPCRPARVAHPGHGDVLTLVERAQERLDHTKAEALEKKLRKERFTLEDFLGRPSHPAPFWCPSARAAILAAAAAVDDTSALGGIDWIPGPRDSSRTGELDPGDSARPGGTPELGRFGAPPEKSRR